MTRIAGEWRHMDTIVDMPLLKRHQQALGGLLTEFDRVCKNY